MGSLVNRSLFILFIGIALYYGRVYFNGAVCQSKARMDGKVVLVTGANTGIGKETVIDLIKRGAKVYMACRNPSKAQAALQDIKKKAKATNDQVIVMMLDLASFASIRTFVKYFKHREPRLDVLINNAGVMAIQNRTLTEDGHEMQFGVNHLGHFLLTNLLLDVIIQSAPSRIVTVSSKAHLSSGPIQFDDLNSEKNYSPLGAYSHSKLANVMFSRELGNKLEGTGVTTYSLHPGAINTELPRHIPYLNHYLAKLFLWPIAEYFLKTIPQGAQTQICCAVDEKLHQQTAKYYSDCVETPPLSAAENDDDCKELWDRSVAMTGLQIEEMVKEVRK